MINYKIAPISIKPSKKNTFLSEVFIAQVDQEKENLAGKLFVLIEIEGKSSAHVKIVNFLIDKINENYYQSDKLILREKIYSLKPEHIFEAALTKTNKQFNQFIESEKLKFKLSSLNITAGLIFDNELYFANRGKNQVFLIHYHKEEAEKKYKIVNISKQTEEKDSKNDNDELFSNVINGKIPEKSHFLISNEALPEYLSHKQIIETITTLPPLGAAEQFKNILTQINYFIVFSGIVIKSQKISSPLNQKQGKKTLSTKETSSSISQTESATEEILGSGKIIGLGSVLKNPFSLFKNKSKNPLNSSMSLQNQIYSQKKPSLFSYKSKIVHFAKNFLIILINFLSYLFNVLKNKEALSKLKNIPKLFISFFRTLKTRLLSFDKKNKILLLIAFVLILLFVINLVLKNQEQKEIETEENYQELVQNIEKKQNQIEANLLYSNDEGAQNLFNELDALLQEFPQETEEQKQFYNTFHKKFTDQLNLIRRLTVYENPEVRADLNNLGSSLKGENIIFDKTKSNLYIADPAQQSIYIMDTKNNTVTTVTDLSIQVSSLKFPVQIDNNSVVYFNDDSFVDLKTENESLSDIPINLPVGPEELIAADSYNSRIYLLSNTENQIYRYTKTGNSYSSPLFWVNESLDMSKAVDMSIDGNIFIINKDGTALKLLRGEKVDFSLEVVDPALLKPTRVVASKESDYLYILEPENKRIIVYDKDGQFIIQYSSEVFVEPKDFALNEEEKSVFILDNNKIYSIPLSHLE